MSPDYADETLSAAIAWGRYAEFYSYDEEADQFYLDEEKSSVFTYRHLEATLGVWT